MTPTAAPRAIATASSRSATFAPPSRMRSCSATSRPTRARPSSTAVTAGTAPLVRIAAMQRSSASRFAGAGNRTARRSSTPARRRACSTRGRPRPRDSCGRSILRSWGHPTVGAGTRAPRTPRRRVPRELRHAGSRRARARGGSRRRTRRPRRWCRWRRRRPARRSRPAPARATAPDPRPASRRRGRAPGSAVLVHAHRLRLVGVAEHDIGFDRAHELGEAGRREHRRRRIHGDDEASLARGVEEAARATCRRVGDRVVRERARRAHRRANVHRRV